MSVWLSDRALPSLLRNTHQKTLVLSVRPFADLLPRLPIYLPEVLLRGLEEEGSSSLSTETRADNDVRELGRVEELCGMRMMLKSAADAAYLRATYHQMERREGEDARRR